MWWPKPHCKFCQATAVVGQMQFPQAAVQPLPMFNTMLPTSTNPYQQSANPGNQQSQSTTDQAMASPNVSFQIPGALGVTGTAVVPAGTTLPGTTPQYLPNNQSGNP